MQAFLRLWLERVSAPPTLNIFTSASAGYARGSWIIQVLSGDKIPVSVLLWSNMKFVWIEALP
jgi:hypothetical protein